jgi:putative lipoic acid-binding regulatory protein
MSDRFEIEFPCAFPIKAMGRAEDAFTSQVVSIVRRHAPDLDESRVQVRASGGGNYVSVTVTITAESRAQLDAIYTELTACEAVMMAL